MNEASRDLPKGFLTHPVHFAAFGFGSGCSPKAPGTVGTIAAIPFYLMVQGSPIWFYIAFVLLAFVIGIWFCAKASEALGVHDHGGIVWDEFVGYWLTMLAAPAGWGWILIGFILFRVFDIWKPYPIGWLDKRVQGGLGIMIDDVVAGVYALICLQGIAWWLVY